jgi:hypothetical protein
MMGAMNEFGHECWIVETSKDGYRRDEEPDWLDPLESSQPMPITLLQMETGMREEL